MTFANGLKSPINGTESFAASSYATAPPIPAPMRTVSSSSHFGSSTSQTSSSSSPLNAAPTAASAADRAGVPRRFTTNALPTLNTLASSSMMSTPLSPIGQQRRQAAEQTSLVPTEFSSAAVSKAQLLQQKKEEFALLKASRDRFSSEMEHSKQELEQLESDIRRLSVAGVHSEPTTPPEHREPPILPIGSNRLSFASLGAVPPIGNSATRPVLKSFHRSTLSGSHHTLGLFPPTETSAQSSNLTSRGNSDEENDEEPFDMKGPSNSRRSAVRNSMPVTNFDFLGVSSGISSDGLLGMNSLSSINSLFVDEDEYPLPTSHRQTASIDNTVLRAETTNDEFPILVRRTTDSNGSFMQNSGMPNPGLANPGPTGHSSSGKYPSYRRHRHGQQSLPMNTLRREDNDGGFSHMRATSSIFDPSRDINSRSSVDLSATTAPIGSNRSSLHMAPPNLRASMSTNDVPTLSNPGVPGLTHAEQHFHNHNASTGRFPHRRNLSSGRIITESSAASLSAALSTSTAAGAIGAPSTTATALPASSNVGVSTIGSLTGVASNDIGSLLNSQVPLYGGPYNMQQGNLGVSIPNMGLTSAQLPYVPYVSNGLQSGRVRDSQQAIIAQRRLQNEESLRGVDNGHYANIELDALVGKIFETSKDQHGARYLQKKIDEDNVGNLAIVFNEVKEHVVELMKDPFGNYLCQRLLEYGTEEQRTILLHKCAPAMVSIATNQHGTRALQRLIEHVETPEQIQVIVNSLKGDVVNLIEDLNGNHVVQKCLNHLRADDAQFIFDAVGANAYKVGIHRHGCCVLQRCIDHASGTQKDRLIAQVIESAYDLSQDQYGNYVIQYILDHATPSITAPLGQTFKGHVVELSKQKFSSNVIEKSIRIFGQVDTPSQRILLEELVIDDDIMEVLIRDSFANYVIQTALEHSPDDLCDRFWEIMVRLLPRIRGTPAGRRIGQKLLQRNNTKRAQDGSGSVTPQESVTPSTNMMAFSMPTTMPNSMGNSLPNSNRNSMSGNPSGSMPNASQPVNGKNSMPGATAPFMGQQPIHAKNQISPHTVMYMPPNPQMINGKNPMPNNGIPYMPPPVAVNMTTPYFNGLAGTGATPGSFANGQYLVQNGHMPTGIPNGTIPVVDGHPNMTNATGGEAWQWGAWQGHRQKNSGRPRRDRDRENPEAAAAARAARAQNQQAQNDFNGFGAGPNQYNIHNGTGQNLRGGFAGGSGRNQPGFF